MYEWGNKLKESEKKQEEYLLGKPIESEGEIITDRTRLNPIVQEETFNQKNENFHKIHEDPLFKIKQMEIQQKQKIMDKIRK